MEWVFSAKEFADFLQRPKTLTFVLPAEKRNLGLMVWSKNAMRELKQHRFCDTDGQTWAQDPNCGH